MKLGTIVSLVIVGLIAGTIPAFAGFDVNTAQGQVLVSGKPAPGLAVHGYDVVAYHTESRPVKGDAAYAVTHGTATYRFASQANMEMFKADPAKYAPAYGGYCAFGVSVGAKFDGDPNYWKIVNGKLYLNLDRDIYAAFNKDVSGSLKKAEANWPKLKDLDPSKI